MNYIIIPATQTEGMDGYSAIAIEVTPENIAEINRLFKSLDDVRKLDSEISRITYDNPKLDVELLNDDFIPMLDKIYVEDMNDELFSEYLEARESKVNSPSIEVSTYQMKIIYDAEYTDSQVFAEITQEEVTEVLTQID